MGMFDTLHYEDKEYQTKDFECLLDVYRIVNKRLLKDDYHYEEVTPKEGGYPRFQRVIDKKDVDKNFHGIFEAHYLDEKNNYHSELFKFTDGNLVEVIKQNE